MIKSTRDADDKCTKCTKQTEKTRITRRNQKAKMVERESCSFLFPAPAVVVFPTLSKEITKAKDIREKAWLSFTSFHASNMRSAATSSLG